MKKPKTINGYIKLLQTVADVELASLRGYNELSYSERHTLGHIVGEIDNRIGDFFDNKKWEDEYRNEK